MAILRTVITVAVCVEQPVQVAAVRHPNCTAPGAGVPFKGKHAQKLRLGDCTGLVTVKSMHIPEEKNLMGI